MAELKEREKAYVAKTESVFEILDRVVAGEEIDAQTAESFDKMRAELREETTEIRNSWDKEAKDQADEDRARTEEAIYKIDRDSGNDTLRKSAEAARTNVRSFHKLVKDNLLAGVPVAITRLPAVISPDPLPAGAGATPQFHYEQTPNKIAGSIEGKNAVHIFTQPRMQVSAERLDMFPESEIGFAGDESDGKREEVGYRALSADMNRLINTVTTGGPGAGAIAPGTNYDPVPQMLGAFEGPMTNPRWWDVKVTPSDINDYRVLQFTSESSAAVRAENTAKSVTDPTTAEVVIGAHKIATDGEFTREALMKNYINSFTEAFEGQLLHEHLTEVSRLLTVGDGTGNNPLGIVTAADAITGVPTHNVTAAAVNAIAINQVTYVELKRLLKPGLRRAPLIAMLPDTLHFRALIAQMSTNAPGFSLGYDMSDANDEMGYLGRLFGLYLQSNEAMSETTGTAGETIGLIVSGKTWCTRTTGTTTTLNPWDEMGRDVVSVYTRTWADGAFKSPQVTGNYTVGRLLTA